MCFLGVMGLAILTDVAGAHVGAQYSRTYIAFHQATAEGTAGMANYYRNELGLTQAQINFMTAAPSFSYLRATAVAARRLGFDFNVVPHIGPILLGRMFPLVARPIDSR
jgi:hypothetical protein